MGVPNTTTFELQDVVDEINPTTDDLVDCFSDATASYFDSSYEGSKNQLLNFRNYGSQNSLTAFFSGSGQSDAKFICSQTINTTKYHDGSGTYPVTGDTVYDNSSGTTTTGNFNYSSGASNGGTPAGYYIITGGSGVVSGSGPCFP